jgi:hypothetical protein
MQAARAGQAVRPQIERPELPECHVGSCRCGAGDADDRRLSGKRRRVRRTSIAAGTLRQADGRA